MRNRIHNRFGRQFDHMGDASQVSPLKRLVKNSFKDDALPNLQFNTASNFGRKPPHKLDDESDNEQDNQSRRDKAKVKARDSAIRLLARREHAKAEIKQKLKIRGFDAELATEVVDDLTKKRLLSDERFADVFVRTRAERGQGPVRLRAELRQLQLPAELIELRIRTAEVDWAVMATQIRQRKFGQKIPKLAAERAKQMRFLQYRGFTADQIRRAMGASFEEDHLLDADETDPVESTPD